MFIVGCYSYYISSNNNSGEDEMNTTINTGNNEQISIGIYKNNDGTYTAMTFSKSKDFKTLKGAQKWLAK